TLLVTSPPFPYTTLFRSLCIEFLAEIDLMVLFQILLGNSCSLEAGGQKVGRHPRNGSGIGDLIGPGLHDHALVGLGGLAFFGIRSEEHTSELQSRENLVC